MPAARRRQLVEGYLARSAERRELLAKLERLTQREREVLALLADGQRAQAVADHFVVSLATVRTQIRAVLTKLEVGSQLEAVALYRRTIER
jgi:DNA-binding NarL/FixJ family response regulator